jgi:hypothetical protein
MDLEMDIGILAFVLFHQENGLLHGLCNRRIVITELHIDG